jgi:hypothetical protein
MMIAATLKSKNGKAKAKAKVHCSNPNCNKDSCTIYQCFTKGGGKEKDTPEWSKKPVARKSASASAHVTNKTEQDIDDNYAMLTYSIPDDPTALVVTSNFASEAHAASGVNGIILDSGAADIFP